MAGGQRSRSNSSNRLRRRRRPAQYGRKTQPDSTPYRLAPVDAPAAAAFVEASASLGLAVLQSAAFSGENLAFSPASAIMALAMLAEGFDTASPSSVAVSLPRFDIRSRTDLIQLLQARGLAAVFDADRRSFEAITTEFPLYVGEAVQQTSLTVGEQGTVAAAVTEIAMMAAGLPVEPERRFVADHPFLIVVQESSTGWDLSQAVINTIDSGQSSPSGLALKIQTLGGRTPTARSRGVQALPSGGEDPENRRVSSSGGRYGYEEQQGPIVGP